MSSRNAMYESSILFGAEDEPVDSCFETGGARIGRLEVKMVDVFGFDFGRADSLLTRTDAGTYKSAMLIILVLVKHILHLSGL